MRKYLTKKNITFWLVLCALAASVFWRQPTTEGGSILRIFVIANLIFILVMSFVLQRFFWHRYRVIRMLLQHIAQVYEEKLTYSFTPVSVIKKNIYNTENTSYVKTMKYNPTTKSTIIIIHEGQEYEFFHHLHEEHSTDLASVLIYYLQKDIPFEILYEQSKSIHTALNS